MTRIWLNAHIAWESLNIQQRKDTYRIVLRWSISLSLHQPEMTLRKFKKKGDKRTSIYLKNLLKDMRQPLNSDWWAHQSTELLQSTVCHQRERTKSKSSKTIMEMSNSSTNTHRRLHRWRSLNKAIGTPNCSQPSRSRAITTLYKRIPVSKASVLSRLRVKEDQGNLE